MNPIKIWYQSYVDYANGKIYWDRLRAHLAQIADPGTAIDVKGITPHDSYAHPIVEFRCAREVICNAVAAQEQGYDAFVIGHFQDAGLYEARSVVDIPVLALGEASMLYGCTLGQHSGIVTINRRYIPWFGHQVRKYGLEQRVTGVHAMTFEPGQILQAYERDDLAAEVKTLFDEKARPLVEQGVDVIIPGGGIPMLLFSTFARSRRGWRAGHQRNSHRDQARGSCRQTAPSHRPRRQSRRGLREAAGRDHRGVSHPPKGVMSSGADEVSVYGAFERTRRRCGARPFLHIPAHCAGGLVDLTYEEAGVAIERTIAGYRQAGYGRGHHVALLLDNRAEFYIHWLALNAIGATIIPIGAGLTPQEADFLLQHGDADLLVHLPERRLAAEDAAHPIVGLAITTPQAVDAQGAPRAVPGRFAGGSRGEAAIIFTSGSTGASKGLRAVQPILFEPLGTGTGTSADAAPCGRIPSV